MYQVAQNKQEQEEANKNSKENKRQMQIYWWSKKKTGKQASTEHWLSRRYIFIDDCILVSNFI